ncbi:MAG: hypothetical protein ABSE16_05350 [Verrucomicrobiota bacterium]|jgi:hypothetical protein
MKTPCFHWIWLEKAGKGWKKLEKLAPSFLQKGIASRRASIYIPPSVCLADFQSTGSVNN